MGYAGNAAPSFVIPTAIATRKGSKSPLEDLDVYIGDEAMDMAKHYAVSYPVRHGQIDNWDLMEAFWTQSFFRYLRCDPESQHVLLVGTAAAVPCARPSRQ